MFQYQKIAEELRARIHEGAYATGRLPAERTLSEEFGVQRDTVRRALEELLQQGVLLRDSTRGTYIAPSLLASILGTTAEAGGAAEATARPVRSEGVLLVVRTREESAVSATIFRGLSTYLSAEGVSAYWYEPDEKGGVGSGSVGGGDADGADYLPPDDLLERRNIRAVVIWPRAWTSLERLRRLRERGPVVLIDRRLPGFEADFVGYRDFESAETVIRHLLSLGHRRIGYLSTESWASTVQARIAGYRAALADAGAVSPPRVLHQDEGSLQFDTGALETFLAGEGTGGPLTAVACANDIVAARLIQYLRRTGRRVPEDVAVVGSGNLLPAMLDAIGLTTLGAPIEELGWASGEMVLDRLRGKAGPSPREIELPMPLIVRESCGSGRVGAAAAR